MKKILVVIGATGTGKSKLAVDVEHITSSL